MKVLMTGAGAPGGPGIIKALLLIPDIDLWIADADEWATGRAIVPNKFVQIPSADKAHFISFLLSFCVENRIDVIVPLVTKELVLFSKAKEAFANAGIRIVVSDSKALEVANDKALLMDHLKNHRIPVADYRRVKDFEALENAAKDFGYPQKKVCVKPSISNGSRGFRVLHGNRDGFEAFFKDKPNNTYSTLEDLAKILKGKEIPEMLVVEYLPGEEYTVDCLVQDKKTVLILPRKRLAMNNGISVKGQFDKNEEIIHYCQSILNSLDLDGPIGIQVKANENGQFRILEINPRLQGTSIASLGFGINLPALAVYGALNWKEKLIVPTINWGLRFARYYNEVFFIE